MAFDLDNAFFYLYDTMSLLIALGINHDTASVAVREQVAFAPEQMVGALQQIRQLDDVAEVAILSTCNRTELYAVALGQAQADSLLHWLANYHDIAINALAEHYYCHQGDKAITHMMQVACGLDSLVLGEPQILGQMKSCYAVAQDAGVLGAELHSTFQQVFSTAKQVRTETAIGENPVSVAYAAVSLAGQIFADLTRDTALLIGAGETIELVARHLRDKGITKMLFANRTLDRAQKLASEFAGEAIMLADIPSCLYRADIVISSTASQLPILGKGAMESALKQRKHRPVFMVDIAVPRDIEVEVDELDDVYLYTVDDLRSVIDEGRKSREDAAIEAHSIIADNLTKYERERKARDSVATIKAYRQQAEKLRDEVLQKALRDLENGIDPAQVLNQMAHNLTNKMLHQPTSNLKQASVEGDQDLIRLSHQLFGLDDIK